MYKLSNYVSVFKKNEYIALWGAANMSKVFGDERLWLVYDELKSLKKINKESLAKYPNVIIDCLLNNQILLEENMDEDNLFFDWQKKAKNIQIKNLVLLISNACNFDCAYCQIEKNLDKRNMKNMSKEVAEKAIDLFKKNMQKNLAKTITITGGEPLLNPEVLKFIIEKVNTEIDNKRIVVFSNGSLIGTDMADFFKKNNVLVLISMDGPEKMHNLTRLDKDGKPTFKNVIKTYNLLKDRGVELGISAVGGKHNVDDLKTLIQFFSELKPASIGLNFSHFLLNQDNPAEIPIGEFGKVLIKFYKAMREQNIFVENISRIINAFVACKPRLHECQAEGSGITVDARGKVGPCKSLLVSDIFSLDIDEVENVVNTEIFVDWSKRSPLLCNKCTNCPAIMLCGGGCGYDSYIVNDGDYLQVDKRVCDYQKYVLEFLIWELFNGIKHKIIMDGCYSPKKREQSFIFNKYYDNDSGLRQSVGH